jgi:Ca-activated chloride channel homolog
MKYVLIAVVALLLNDPIKVRRVNKIKAEAKDAFQAGQYKEAAAMYKLLVDSMDVKEDEVLLNLAHANFLMKDTANAFNNYQTLTQSPKKDIVSKANQQLGVMTNQQGKAEQALNYFKQAIKADPTNESARYDYEMLKKKLDEQKKQQQQQNQQNKDQEKKDQQNKDQEKKEEQEKQDQEKKDQENKEQQEKDEQQKKEQQQKDKEQQEKEEKEKQEQEKEQQEKDQKEKEKKEPNLDRQKLEQMKISEEKARMILEAMKNQEKQYLQQNKRKATKSRDRNKPDW